MKHHYLDMALNSLPMINTKKLDCDHFQYSYSYEISRPTVFRRPDNGYDHDRDLVASLIIIRNNEKYNIRIYVCPNSKNGIPLPAFLFENAIKEFNLQKLINLCIYSGCIITHMNYRDSLSISYEAVLENDPQCSEFEQSSIGDWRWKFKHQAEFIDFVIQKIMSIKE